VKNGKLITAPVLVVVAFVVVLIVVQCATNAQYAVTGEIRDIRRINTRGELSQVLGGAPLSQLDLVDVSLSRGSLFVVAQGPRESLFLDERSEYEFFEYDLRVLFDLGIDSANVQAVAVRSGNYRDRQIDSFFNIYWIQLQDKRHFDGNFIFIGGLPSQNMTINTRRIMNE